MIEVKDKRKILAYLKEKGYLTLNVQGVINNTDKTIYTDDLEQPTGVFVRDNYFTFMYAEDEGFVKAFDGFVKDETFLGFSGANRVVRDYYFKHVLVQWDNPCHQMHFEGDVFEHVMPLENLVLEDAEYVDDNYEYKNDHSLAQVKDAIEKRPTSGLRVDGKLVSFVLLHQDDSIGYMYTLPEYRGKGYAYELTKDIVNKTLASGRLPYIQIVHGNDKSVGLAKKAGFVDHGDVYWFGIIRPSGKEFQEFTTKYQDFFKEQPAAVTSRETCEMHGELLEVAVSDFGFECDGVVYPVTWHFDDGVYYVRGDMPKAVMVSGLVRLMEEPWHIALVNQPIQHPAFAALKKLD